MMWKILQETPGCRRVSEKNGITKIEVWTTGKTGKTLTGQEAAGHYKVRGYKAAGVFFETYQQAKNHIR